MKSGCGSVLLALAVGSIVIWNLFIQPSYEHRFRITIAVKTPEGKKQGSSVWANTCTDPLPGGLGAMTGGCSTVGEAVFVDLGQGRNLIGLMTVGPDGRGVNVYGLAARVFDYEGVPRNTSGNLLTSWISYAPHWRGSRELSGDAVPTLVTLTDLNDPASARLVEPTQASFASVVGPGYQLQQVILEMVPVGLWPFNVIGFWGTPLTGAIEAKIPALRASGRPAAIVLRAAGLTIGSAIDPESVFRRN
jgi:hypothetical protein